jgi:integrase
LPTESLTDARVRGTKFADGEIVDIKTGLIVRADRSGAVTFSFRYRANGARRRIVLGKYPGMTLADARAVVARMREQVRNGEDPQQARIDRREALRAAPALTFDALADRYMEHYAKRRKISWRCDEGYLRAHVRPAWGKRDATTIVRRDAAQLLLDIAARAPVTANRTRSMLITLFGWAVDNALLADNPMLGTKSPHRERGKTRTLNDAEIRVLWRSLDNSKAAPRVAAALRVMLLLGQRPGEVAGMAVDELHDLDYAHTALWAIPAHRMKARKSHAVPLPALAREIILAELARPVRGSKAEFVLAESAAQQLRLARHHLAETLARVIAGLDDDEIETVARLRAVPPTPHDLRRTAASGMARLNIPRDDRLAVLAHSYGDVHEAHYDHFDRLPQKRAALVIWERHVRKVISGEPTGAEVIALHRHAHNGAVLP